MAYKHPLYTFVHRTLVYRLIIVGLSFSIISGVAMLFIERDRVSQEVIDFLVDQISVFIDRYDYLIVEPENLVSDKIHQAIMKSEYLRPNNKLGSFVYLSIYDVNGQFITEVSDTHSDNLGEIKKKYPKINIEMPVNGHKQYEIVFIAGLPHLKIVLPISNKSQEIIGFINAFFVFSDATIKASRVRGLRAMIGTVIVVFLTTAILYPVVLRLARRITQFSEQLFQANIDTLEILGNAIAVRDSDTNAHNYRVTIYAVSIGEELGLPNKTMRTLIKGSFLHDVGKIGIPDTILRKPGKLNDAEFKIMKTHVELGRKILERSMWFEDSLEIVLAHHEKISGKGYPLGLSGEEIPITARIFAIADVFDALTSKRPYKEAWSFEKAMEIMNKERGFHFDPFLIDIFNRIARSLYDIFGGKEEVFQKELGAIIKKYFHEEISNLEY